MYVVVGPSGRVGSVVAGSLLDRGLRVQVVVRSAGRGTAWLGRGATVAVADVRDPDALARALDGATAAFLQIPDALGEPRFAAYQDAVAESIARAADRSGLARGVFLSAIDANLPGHGPASGLGRAERRLATGRTAWTFLRSAAFLENVAFSFGRLDEGALGTFFPPALALPMVSVRDVGRVAADLLIEAAPGVVELDGAPLAMDEVAAALSRRLGRPIRAEHAPLEAVVPIFTARGASEDAALHLRDLYASQIHGVRSVRAGRVGTTSLEDVLGGLLGGPA